MVGDEQDNHAKSLRPLLGTGVVAAVFAVVVGGIGLTVTSTAVTWLLPFVAAEFSVAGLAVRSPWNERVA